MSSPGDLYLNQTKKGESRWWSWIMVIWFVIIGWLIAQVVFISPIGQIAQTTDPETAQTLNEASSELLGDPEAIRIMLVYGAAFLLSILLGVIGWIFTRFTQSTVQKVFGVITGLCVAGSFYSLYRMAPYASDSESNAAMGDLMGSTPVIYALFLLVFPATCLALYGAYMHVHKRTVTSLHTAYDKINWRRGIQAFLITWAVLGSLTAIIHFTGISPIRGNFQPSTFFTYALISLLIIPLQSGTEEIIFRGYLNQAFFHLFRNKWIVFTITSALFASVHLANPEALKGAEQGVLPLTMSSYFFFGFVACLLVWMDGGLESAIGFHAANNTFAAVFVNYEGSVLPTPSLFMVQPDTYIDIAVTLAALAIIGFLLYRTRSLALPSSA